MAPALTEAGQSQNFKLPPSSHSSPASPIGIPLNGFKNLAVPQYLSDKLSLKDDQLRQYINCGIFDKAFIGLKNGLVNCSLESHPTQSDNISTVAITSDLLNDCTTTQEESLLASDNTDILKGDLMMNSSDPSMGDQLTNMGLQKSVSNTASYESSKFPKDKSTPSEVDQLLKNLSVAISESGIVNNVGLGENVEDILQVISSMETNAVQSDSVSVGGLDHNDSGETEAMFQISEGNDITGGLTNFERDLLNDVDMIDMCVDDNLGEGSLNTENKTISTKEHLEVIRKRQFELQRRREFMTRRLRKLQARTMGKHVTEELMGLLEQSYRSLNQNTLNESCKNSVANEGDSANNIEHKFKDKIQGLSRSSISSLFRKLDLITQQQAFSSARFQINNKSYGSSPDDSNTVSNNGTRTLLKYSSDVKQELENVAGQLQTQIKFVENELDSDVTASSSGGDSCDEMQPNSNSVGQQALPIEQRAVWRWAQHRARVASRWTWLQAQISDLEYRIRQHNDIHRQIRTAKDPVVLAETPSTSSIQVPAQIFVNGFHGGVSQASVSHKDESSCCARTRPVVRSLLTKRKLLRVSGLHTTNKRAARPSSIRCACHPPDTWCALCTGRHDPTEPRPSPRHLPLSEKAALLDPCFHPVLSMPNEIKESVHYEAMTRTSDWQQKTIRSSLKSLKTTGNTKFEKDLAQDRRNKKRHIEHRRKYTSRLKKTVTSTLTAKIKRKLTKGRKPKNHDPNNHSLQRLKGKRMHIKSGAATYTTATDGEDDVEAAVSSKHTSRASSPCPSGGTAPDRLSILAASKAVPGDIGRRKRENSYDIDNIVIPYSIAASTRLEKLQYKEILTPKWRVCDYSYEFKTKLDLKNNGVVRRSSQECDIEDLSDETLGLRHDRCEAEEKKKFMSYIKLPYSGRSRSHRRTDSRAESSGANTPDPLSPNNAELINEAGASPVMSPIPTHGTESDTNYQSLSTRRRTISQSRWGREDVRSTTPDNILEVPPYESRTFPLPEDVYEKMLKYMPEGHPFPPLIIEPKTSLTKDTEYGEGSRPVSPSTDSTESAICEGEDPNDPEWTVDDEKEFERIKTSAKR